MVNIYWSRGSQGRRIDPMPMSWFEVEKRYDGGVQIPTVAGGKTLQVTSVDAAGVHIRNALWRDTLLRQDLEKAVDLIEQGRMSRDAGRFVEEYRVLVADVRATSAAHVLKDLGFLE
jgi:hypothetical protein